MALSQLFRSWVVAVFMLVAIAPLPTLAESSPNPIIGRWKGNIIVPHPVTTFEFVFSEKGRLVFLALNWEDTLSAEVANYSVNLEPKPMHLDLVLQTKDGKGLAKTIFEVAGDGKLRLQLADFGVGQPRPQRFRNETLLSRVSTVFDEQKLASAEQSGDREGQVVMAALVRSAVIQILLQNKLPTTSAELGLKADTANYRYQLLPQSNQLQIVALPKRQGLESYSGLIIKFDAQLGLAATAKVCVSSRPSLLPPHNADFA